VPQKEIICTITFDSFNAFDIRGDYVAMDVDAKKAMKQASFLDTEL